MLYFHQQLYWHGMKFFLPNRFIKYKTCGKPTVIFYESCECFRVQSTSFESITQWAQKHNIEIGQRFRWLVDELADLRTNRILVTGTSGNGKLHLSTLY